MRYYINANYDEREDVKKLGARWDGKCKKWYFDKKEDIPKFKKWLPDVDWDNLKTLSIICDENGFRKDKINEFLIENKYIQDVFTVLPLGETLGIIQNGSILYYNENATKFIIDKSSDIPDVIDSTGSHEILKLVNSGKNKKEIVSEIGIKEEELDDILAKLYKSKRINIKQTLLSEQYDNLKEKIEDIINSGYQIYEIESMLDTCKKELKAKIKEKKINERKEEVLSLVELGFSVSDISEQMELGIGSIERILQELIRENKVDVRTFLSSETEEKIIEAVKSIENWDYRLTPIKEILPEEISFFEIRLTIEKNNLRNF